MSVNMSATLKDTARNLVTLRYLAPPLSSQLFFIFGCQRSGTTLLLSMLKAHPQVTAVDETEFPSPYPFPSAQRLAVSKLSNRYLCFKMLEHSDKLSFLKQFYPNARVLWPIRNPHSTISSMLNLKNSDGDWIDRCVSSEINRLMPFFSSDLKDIDLATHSKVEQAALYWLYKNKYPIWLRKKGFEVLTFKYEDLLENQKLTIEQLLNFLGIDWSDDVLQFYQKNPSLSLAGGTRTDRPVNKERASRLQSNLSPKEIEKINSICAPVMSEYGYSAMSW